MRYLICLILLFACFDSHSATVSVDKLFREIEFRQFTVSPGGDLIGAWRAYDDTDTVIISAPAVDKNYVIFKLEDTKKSGIRGLVWIDRDSLLVKYSDFQGVPHYLVIDCTTNKDGTLELKSSDTVLLGDLVDPLPNEQDKVLMSIHIPNQNRLMDVYKVDLREIDKDYKFRGRLNKGLNKIYLYGTDSKHRLRFAAEKKKKERNFLYKDLADGKWKQFFSITQKDKSDDEDENEEEGQIIFIDFMGDYKMIVASNVGRDKLAILEFDLREKKFGKVLFESQKYDVEFAEMDSNTGGLRMVKISEDGKTRYKYFSPQDKELKAKLGRAFGGKNAKFYDASLDGKKILVLVFSETNPGTFYYVDVETLSARPLADANPELEGATLRQSETISVKSKDGLMIEGFITLPVESDEKHPLIVMPHGGPIGARDYDLFSPEVQFFADRGFAVLRVNYRGSGGYGKEFAKKGVGQWGKGIEDDIDLSVEHVLENYPIDREKMCFVGASYGGYSALMSVIRSPEKYRCAVSRFGVTDLSFMFNETNTRKINFVRKAWENVMGDPDDSDFDPVSVSPFYLAEKIQVPVMLTSGWDDMNADPEHTNRLKVALDLLGKPYHYLLYQDAAHGHKTWHGDRHEMIMIERFLRESLGLKYPDTEQDVDIQDKERSMLATIFDKGDIVYTKSKSKAKPKVTKTEPKEVEPKAAEPKEAPESTDAEPAAAPN